MSARPRSAVLPRARRSAIDRLAGPIGRGAVRTGLVVLLLAILQGPARADPLASAVFGEIATPASTLPPRAIGSYSRGCLAGAVPLAADGASWQAMRLSRNHNWGHPDLVAFVERLGVAAWEVGLNGILVGDLSQPRGGPMPHGHASHQTGLDVDIWLREMPAPRLTVAERETFPFRTVLDAKADDVDPERLTPAFAALLGRAARDAAVERIFVHPLIKRALCESGNGATGERPWLGKIRPWYGHHEHFHVRLACPAGSPDCTPQNPPPDGDGCGEQLAYWFTPAPYQPSPNAAPKPPLTLARMPNACRSLVE
ncbi:penicillin-insensitive murein endopeptidase [Acuticoccus sp. M5D2P5]|uniref:penicillin-insensitive murein endopeptidase n=1 Tax=Acuticoccus kalidii TaxID=2910977 RepID=UPI001F45A9F1|nr:penicillin-insensitive murein endopeptidase [Acuticoccus kalidii]MCF3933946.1 penicillin-insensitive murein endopeptidase [Acuticoccus kalidii]